MCKMTAGERTLETIELIRAVLDEKPDEIDSLLCKNGVLYNSEDELDYQEQHE